MRRISFTSIAMVGLGLAMAVPLKAQQIRSNWFDINPPQSNTDASNPNGASGGRIHNLGAFNDMSLVFAATEWGGLWQSFNQGLTWVRNRTFLPSATYDVKVAPPTTQSPQGTVYVTSFHDGRVPAIAGISFSRDRGATWTTATLPPGPCQTPNDNTEPAGWTISINPTNPAKVFIGTNCGLAMTTNSGTTWTYLDPSGGASFEPVFAVLSHANTVVDVITQNGFFYSRNDGANWVQGTIPAVTGGPATNLPGGIGDLAVSPYESHVLYASVAGQLRESLDSGRTWPTSITVPTGGGRIPFIATNRRSATNRYDLWYGGVQLFRTTCSAANPPNIGGGGARAPLNSWGTDLSTPAGAHNDFGDIMFAPGVATDACPVLVCCDGGVYRNTTAAAPGCQNPTWEQPNITPHTTWLYGFDGMIGSNGLNHLYYGLQDNGIWGTTFAPTGPFNPSPVWHNPLCCDGFGLAADQGEIVHSFGSVGPPRPFILLKGNEGVINNPQIPNYPSTAGILTFASGRTVVRYAPNSFAITLGDGVYLTNNINANQIVWTYISHPTAPTSTAGGGLKATIDQGNPNIFYKTGGGKPYQTGQIFLYGGTSAGSTWTQVPLPVNMTSFTVYDVDPNNSRRMMACAIDGANNFSTWRTTDGTNWQPMGTLDNLMTGNGAFQNSSTRGPQEFYPNFGRVWQPYMFEINPNNGNIAVAGAADAGIFLTTDFGSNWVRLTNPLNVTSLVSSAPHIPRPLFAWFSTTRFANATSAFDVWVGTQGAGVQKFLVESP